MARDSSYSYDAPNGSASTDAVDFTSNPLSSSQTQISFVCRHRRDVAALVGIGFNWTGSNGDFLFRDNAGTLQIYQKSGGVQYGPATASTSLNTWQWKGFRFDGSLASGNRLAAFIDGVKGTDAAGATSQDAATGTLGFGYHGSSSLLGWGGQLRDAFLWVGKALPDSAYAAINAGVHPLVFGPTHWWPMDNILADLVGGNHLTNAGANVSFINTQSPGFIPLPSGIMVPHRVSGAPPVSAWYPYQQYYRHLLSGRSV